MPPRPLDEFRSYLEVLARAQIGPRLRRKLSVSDVVQNTMLEAHRAVDAFRGSTPRQQAAWMRRILVDQIAFANRHYRYAKRDMNRERSLEASLDRSSARLERWLEAEQSSPSQRVDRDEQLVRMVEAIASLPEDEQDVLLLRFCQDMSLEAIAQELEVSRNTVARRVRRGLETLRSRLQAT